MRFAFFKDERIEATKGAKGVCPCCGSELIAKCGEVYAHYWSHKKKCVDHWWENEKEWHRNWKNQFPKEWQEVIHRDESGEKHIADVKTSEGWAIEFQHSYLKPEERRSRNNFYNKLIWVVDGTRRPTDAKQLQKIFDEGEFRQYGPSLLHIHFPEDCRLLKEWGNSNSLVFLDFNDERLWLIYPRISGNRIFLNSFQRNSFIELLNNNKFDEILDTMINPIQKDMEDLKQENIRSERVNIINTLNRIKPGRGKRRW